MKRIEKLLGSISEVDHLGDVYRLRSEIFSLSDVSLAAIHSLYEDWSDTFSAGWLIVDDSSIADFSAWLEQEVE